MDVAETALTPEFKPHGLALAIVLSIGLHLLFVWYLGNWYQARSNLSPSSLRRPLHISITAPAILQSERQQVALPEPAPEQNQATKPHPKKQQIDKVQAEPEPLKTESAKPTIAGVIRDRAVTAAQIRHSAAAIVSDIAEDAKVEQGKKSDSVSAILERALNKPREKPGVHTQADGTTRVVTEHGFTYCIKAIDDWRIMDPEDDLRVSMYCN